MDVRGPMAFEKNTSELIYQAGYFTSKTNNLITNKYN